MWEKERMSSVSVVTQAMRINPRSRAETRNRCRSELRTGGREKEVDKGDGGGGGGAAV
jgi:hypothetical protein